MFLHRSTLRFCIIFALLATALPSRSGTAITFEGQLRSNEIDAGHTDHDDHDDHADDDHSGDESGLENFEWVGVVDLSVDSYTVTFSKKDGIYQDEHMVMVLWKVDDNWQDNLEKLQIEASDLMLHGLEEGCRDLHEHEHEHEDEEHEGEEIDETDVHDDHDDHLDEESEHADGDDLLDEGEEELHSEEDDHACATVVEQGSNLVLSATPTLLAIEFDSLAAATLVTLSIKEEGKYLFFLQHAPSEFQGAVPWLMSSTGEEMELLQVAGEEEICRSGLSDGEVWGYSILGSMIGASMSLIGVVFLIPALNQRSNSIIVYLNSLACGVLLSLVIVHLIPESVKLAGPANTWKVSACIMAGFCAGMLLEHCLRLRGGHHHGAPPAPESQDSTATLPAAIPVDWNLAQRPPEAMVGVATEQTAQGLQPIEPVPVGGSELVDNASQSALEEGKPPVIEARGIALILNILVGDLFHNFFDGIVISLAFRMCGLGMGWTVTISAIIHELPQEISDFIILVDAGLSPRKALGLNFLSSLSSILGVVVVTPIGKMTTGLEEAMGLVLATGSGVLLYIAVSLVPGILAVSRTRDAAICWLTFAIGAIIVGLTLLNHIHCECEDSSAAATGMEDPHAGHDH